MLSRFHAWATALLAGLPQGVAAGLNVCPPSANPAIRLELDTPTALASLVCWESGNYAAEVLDVRTEQYRCQRLGEFSPDFPLSEQLNDFLTALQLDLAPPPAP